MTLPASNILYKEQSYWDERFKSEKVYEWFRGYSWFRHLVLKHVEKTDKILILGCGNSELSEEMYQDGFKNIVNVDFSPVVIKNMSEKTKKCTEMSWIVMDILDLKFGAETFDVVIEKGTLDALMVGEKSVWTPSEETRVTVDRSLSEVSRVLKKDGKFISITFAQPQFRRLLLARTHYNWGIHVDTFGSAESFEYFFYIMKKGEELSPEDKKHEIEFLKTPEDDKVVNFMRYDDDDFLQRIGEEEDP